MRSVQLNTKVPTIQIVQKISSKLPKNAIIPKIFITTRNQSTKKGNKKLELEKAILALVFFDKVFFLYLRFVVKIKPNFFH